MTKTSHQFSQSLIYMLIGSAIILALSLGVRHGFGLYLVPMSHEFGWGQHVFSLAIAMQNLIWGAVQPFTGAIADKYGSKVVVTVGGLLYTLGLLLMAFSSSVLILNLSLGLIIGLDHKVDLINTQQKLLSYLDDEIADALSYHLREQGVLIRHNEQMDHLETFDDHVVLHLQSGKKIKADAILWCNGRSGNTEGLGLENVGLVPNSRGQLSVNDQYQTEVENIYAAGDVIGWPSLASAAYDQGRCAG
ncbi:FAD-dependent oxidoreductase, partial [Acinetobacter baumannii]